MSLKLSQKEYDQLRKKLKEDKLPIFYQDIFPRIVQNLDERISKLEEKLKIN